MNVSVQRFVSELFKTAPGLRFSLTEMASAVFFTKEPSRDHIRSVRRAADNVAATYGRERMHKDGETYYLVPRRNIKIALAAKYGEVEVREARIDDTLDFETRFTAPTDTGEIEGVAVRFNTVDSYRTEFAPDAFRGLEGRSVPMLWAHDPSSVIGSWSSFQVRADGLTAKGKLNLAVAKALEVRSLLQAGDIKGLSIGFRTVKDQRRSNGVRRITEAALHEISIVAFPSVPGSGITSVRTTAPDFANFTRAVRAATATLRKGLNQ